MFQIQNHGSFKWFEKSSCATRLCYNYTVLIVMYILAVAMILCKCSAERLYGFVWNLCRKIS